MWYVWLETPSGVGGGEVVDNKMQAERSYYVSAAMYKLRLWIGTGPAPGLFERRAKGKARYCRSPQHPCLVNRSYYDEIQFKRALVIHAPAERPCPAYLRSTFGGP